MRATSTPTDYNVKLYLVAACVYAALQAADRLPPSAGQQPGTPKAAVVAGAAGGRSLLLGLPAGPDLTKGPAGPVESGGALDLMRSTYTRIVESGHKCSTELPGIGGR